MSTESTHSDSKMDTKTDTKPGLGILPPTTPLGFSLGVHIGVQTVSAHTITRMRALSLLPRQSCSYVFSCPPLRQVGLSRSGLPRRWNTQWRAKLGNGPFAETQEIPYIRERSRAPLCVARRKKRRRSSVCPPHPYLLRPARNLPPTFSNNCFSVAGC
jgi:hypothetical protein